MAVARITEIIGSSEKSWDDPLITLWTGHVRHSAV